MPLMIAKNGIHKSSGPNKKGDDGQVSSVLNYVKNMAQCNNDGLASTPDIPCAALTFSALLLRLTPGTREDSSCQGKTLCLVTIPKSIPQEGYLEHS